MSRLGLHAWWRGRMGSWTHGRVDAWARGCMGALACVCACSPRVCTMCACMGAWVHGCMWQACTAQGLCACVRVSAACACTHGRPHSCSPTPLTPHACNKPTPPSTHNHHKTQVVEGDLVQSARVDLDAPCALAHPLLSFPRSAGLGWMGRLCASGAPNSFDWLCICRTAGTALRRSARPAPVPDHTPALPPTLPSGARPTCAA